MSIDIHIYDRQSPKVEAIDFNLSANAFSEVSFSTILPGGMGAAKVKMPWKSKVSRGQLLGFVLDIRYNGDSVWWGRITEVNETYTGNAVFLEISALGPWAFLAKRRFTGNYNVAANWTARDLLRVILFGNTEDIAWVPKVMIGEGKAPPAVALQDSVSFDGTVQEAIVTLLQAGDGTSKIFSMIVKPPERFALFPVYRGFDSDSVYGYPIGSTCDDQESAASIFGASVNVSWDTTVYQRGNSRSYKFAAPASCHAFRRILLGSAMSAGYAQAWYYLPQSAPSAQTDLMQMEAGTGSLLLVRITASGILQVRNQVSASNYAGSSFIFPRGSWHCVTLYGKTGTTTGEFNLFFDDQSIASSTNLNVSSSNINRVIFGLSGSSASARTLYCDSWIISPSLSHVSASSAVAKGWPALDEHTEELPYPVFLDLSDVSDYEILVDADDFIGDYGITESLMDAYNQVVVQYSTSSKYTAISAGSDSIGKYGQLPIELNVQGISGSQTATWFADGYLSRYQEPKKKLGSFTVRSPVRGEAGQLMPLPYVSSGMRMTIMQRPELGNIYIGQTEYRCTGAGIEELSITPEEPEMSLTWLIAKRKKRNISF